MWRMRYCASFSGEKCTHLPLPVAIATITIKMHAGSMEELITATQGWGRMVWWGFCFLVMWPNMPTFWSCYPYWYKSLACDCFIQLQFLHSLINRLETWWVGAQWSHLTILTIFKVKGQRSSNLGQNICFWSFCYRDAQEQSTNMKPLQTYTMNSTENFWTPLVSMRSKVTRSRGHM